MNIRKVNTERKTISLVFGVLIIVIGIIPITGGAAILLFNRSADAKGYHWSNTYEVRTSTQAFTLKIPSLSTVSLYSRFGSSLFGADNAVQGKWVIDPLDTSRDLFSCLSTASEGENYVSKMETEGTTWYPDSPFKPQLNITSLVLSGERTKEPVKSPWWETFWLNACYGRGQASIEYIPVWDTPADDKYLIIMNSDGTNNVAADMKLGFNFPVFRWLPYRLIPLGVLICAGGVLLIGKRRAKPLWNPSIQDNPVPKA